MSARSPVPCGTISSLWVRGLLEAVEAAGIAPADFLASAGLASDRFAAAYAWVPSEEFDRLAALAVERTGDPAFGLHWTQRSPMNRFDLFAMIATHAPTLRHAMDCIISLQQILGQRHEIESAERRGSFFMHCAPVGSSELGRRIRAEVILFGFLRFLRYAGVPTQAVRGLTFAHAAPPYAAEYARMSPRVPSFDQARSGVELSSAWLDEPLGGANTELYEVLKRQAGTVLLRVQHNAGYAARVHDLIRDALPRIPDMQHAARALSSSVRSLRRRLEDEGRSYSELVREVQEQAARELLADPRRSIKQVSDEVGFQSEAGFARAFKRWTGETPSAFRSR